MGREWIKMTNEEKFNEVFGFKVQKASCPLRISCIDCKYECGPDCSYEFWEDEYKENKE